MANVKAGETYTYNGPVRGGGNDGLSPGASVEVRELVSADTKGAHNDAEDCIVVEWDAPSIGRGEDGQHAVVHTKRAMSVGVGDFAANFTKG